MMKLTTIFLLVFCCSCSGQNKELPYPNLKGNPKVVGPKIVDSGFPMPIAIFSDSTRTDMYYSGWTNYSDFYIANPDDSNSPIIVHEKIQANNITFETAATEVAKKYGFDNFKIDLIKQSQFYLNHNLTVAHGLAKTELNNKTATGIIQGQKLDENSIFIILTIVQDDLFEKWAGINILLMQMGYIQTFKTLPKNKIEIAVNGSSNEKLEYFEKVNARAQTAISNQSVRKGKINKEIMKMLSDQSQFDIIQFQWDINNDILYGNGW
ncbi:hypothetical protein ACJD0Z_04575 [Flavobacteriaceae bacterium M23B6Z8]